MSQTEVQLVKGLNLDPAAPADATVVDSSGRFLVGATASVQSDGVIQAQGSSGGNIALYQNTDAATAGSKISFLSDGGATAREQARIFGYQTTTSASGGYLGFSTTASAGSSPTERLRISQSGAFGLSGANYGTSGQVLTSQGSGSAPQWAAGGKILQVVSVIKTDTFTTSSTSPVSITGLYATITPTSTSSKILVIANISSGNSGNYYGNEFYLYYHDGSTTSVISAATGDAAGGRKRASSAYRPADGSQTGNTTIQYLHSPAKNTSIYYQIYASTESASYDCTVNRTGGDGNNSAYARTTSTVTLLEVAG